MTHTPGPWKIDNPFPNEIYIDGANGRSVAYVIHNDDERTEQGDDARLIAAAPDLLAACDQTISDLQGIANIASGGCDEQEGAIVVEIVQHIADSLSIAIAKARGG